MYLLIRMGFFNYMLRIISLRGEVFCPLTSLIHNIVLKWLYPMPSQNIVLKWLYPVPSHNIVLKWLYPVPSQNIILKWL